MKRMTIGILVATILAVIPAFTQATGPGENERRLTEQVRHELVMLPYYSVFDHIQFRVEGDRVILLGKVSRPTLKTAAGRVVKHIEGIKEIDNQVKVLPLSSFDDRIRLGVYRALFRNDMLSRYSLGAMPSIHIIVENGDVALEGSVATDAERNVAGMMANGVSGVFSVQNNLRVDRKS